jgi:type II secretory pathway pseudopilin PulG
MFLNFLNNKTKAIKNFSSKRGLTLIEILVAFVIFSVIMISSVGALVGIIDANRKAQAVQSALNNLNFALDNMTRNIRTGFNYHCLFGGAVPVPPALADIDITNDCDTGGNLIAFEGPHGERLDNTDQIIYRHNATNQSIEASFNAGTTWVTLTAPELQVEKLQFFTTFTSRTSAPHGQAMVMFTMTVRASEGDSETTLTVQTAIAQRLLDF